MKSLTLTLPDDLSGQLEKKARALGRSKSALVREALTEMLAYGPAQSCHDLMKAGSGSWKNTPRDFATNRKYLKGFGQ